MFAFICALSTGDRVGRLTEFNLLQLIELSLIIPAIGPAGDRTPIGRALMTLIVLSS